MSCLLTMTLHLVDVRLTCLINITYLLTITSVHLMTWRCRLCWRGHVFWQPRRVDGLTLFHHRFVLMQDLTLRRLLINRQLFQRVFYKYAVDSDFPWSSTTSLTMCTLYATITGLRAASTQKPCDIHFTRVFTCSVYTFSDSSCLQASSGRECPLCRQRHLSNMF